MSNNPSGSNNLIILEAPVLCTEAKVPALIGLCFLFTPVLVLGYSAVHINQQETHVQYV